MRIGAPIYRRPRQCDEICAIQFCFPGSGGEVRLPKRKNEIVHFEKLYVFSWLKTSWRFTLILLSDPMNICLKAFARAGIGSGVEIPRWIRGGVIG